MTDRNPWEEALQSATDAALAVDDLGAAAQAIADALVAVASSGIVLHLENSRIPTPLTACAGMECSDELEAACCSAMAAFGSGLAGQDGDRTTDRRWFPVADEEGRIGVLGVAVADLPRERSPDLPVAAWRRFGVIVGRVVDRTAAEHRIEQLNAYLTVSSSLGRALDLPEALEIALYCSMEAVGAEAASVLLLDDARENLTFYSVEGPAQPVLQGASFPATQGIAGAVLESLEPQVIDDAHADTRFYERIDSESGFRTRNMIAVPLVAGEERVGVLEVLNKADGSPFTAEEKLLLVAIADQIAFAIRNARIFECLVDSYCNRRKGIYSCKGCHRPLGSWTPCMRYHDPDL
jgi:GAF domain-containing protein